MRMIVKIVLFMLLPFVFCISYIGMYAQPVAPVLRLETGMHSARGNSLSVDAGGRYLLSCSADKTARLWDAATGKLLNTLRIPIGGEEQGLLYACALNTGDNMAALGGWTGDWEKTDCIYILNPFTGVMIKRLCGLPNVINCLAFSKDGKYLAAGLGKFGVRIYDVRNWQVTEIGDGYNEPVTGLIFNKEGNLVTVSSDGYLRLYRAQNFSLLSQTNALAGNKPFSVAFNPDGNLLAVGYDNSTAVDVFTTSGLALAYRPDVSNIPVNQDISAVSFSSDGNTLYAGGAYANLTADDGNKYVVRKWNEAGKGSYDDISLFNNTIIAIRSLPEGKMAFLSTNPDIAELDINNSIRWFKTTDNINFAANGSNSMKVSVTGDAIQVVSYPKDLFFKISSRSISGDNSLLYPPVTESNLVQLSGWQGSDEPAINNVPPGFLADNETCRAACLCSDGTRIAWGGDYNLYLTNSSGKLLWKQPLTEAAFAVNISGDGKLIIAALGDGTIRWYNIVNGTELLALYMSNDHQRWILFTSKGYYDASSGAEDLLGWHVNNGPDKSPAFYPASRFKSIYYRPDIIDGLLTSHNENAAIANANTGNTKSNATGTILANHLPPVIIITSPYSGAAVSSDIVPVTYNVQSPDAPVSNIKVLIDGRPLTGQRGMHLAGDSSNTIMVPVPNQNCTITLLAENNNGTSPAANVYITRNTTGNVVVSDSKPKLFILAVGISDYNNPGYKLNYAADDAKSFADVFSRQRNVEYSDVVVKLLTDKDATREKIQVALEWIQDTTTQKDVAMIFFAGHGVNDNKGYFYMAPVGADIKSLRSTCLNFRELTQTVSAITGKVVVFIDACHSGDVTGGRGSFGDINSTVNDLSGIQNGAVVFTSSTGREYSLENSGWQHGAFTKALLDGIGKGGALIKGKNTISIKSLDLYISQKVEELTGNQQHPTTVVPPNIPDFTIAVFNQ